MDDKDQKQIAQLLIRDIGLETSSEVDETVLLSAIIDRVTWMMKYDTNLLMSYLYRLDILEHKINAALTPGNPLTVEEALAVLILERQKERVATKKKYKQDPIEGWEF